VTAVRVEREASRVAATRHEHADAGRAYLRTVRAHHDPLLVTRVRPGRTDVRVFPVDAAAVTRVVLDGFAIVGNLPPSRARGYADATHLLAIRRHEVAVPVPAHAYFDAAASRVIEVRALPAGSSAPVGFAAVPAGGVAALGDAVRATPQRWLALEPEAPELVVAPVADPLPAAIAKRR